MGARGGYLGARPSGGEDLGEKDKQRKRARKARARDLFTSGLVRALEGVGVCMFLRALKPVWKNTALRGVLLSLGRRAREGYQRANNV